MNIHPKVAAATIGAGLGSAVADVFVWWLSTRGVVLPVNVAQDLSVIADAVLALAAGYFTPSPKP